MIASTVIPLPVTLALESIAAVFEMSATLRPTAAPIWLEDSPDVSPAVLSAVPIARAVASVEFCALTMTGPLRPTTVRPLAMRAVFDVLTQLTLIAAATPTPLPELPLLPLASPLPCVVFSFALGSVPTPWVLVFGLLPTCLLALLSDPPSESLELAPDALASAFAPLFIVEAAVIATVVAFRLRAVSASVVHSRMTLIETSAPIAVLPAASAFAVVFETSVLCVAVITTAPLAMTPAPAVPRRAVTWSALSTTSATAGVIAVPPFDPATTAVSITRDPSAVIVRLPTAPSETLFSISARTIRSMRMLRAIEAPTPVFPAFAVEVACAVSFSSLSALTETSPPPTVRLAPSITTASVRAPLTMLIARAPATLVPSDAPEPDLATAANVCTVSPATFVFSAWTSRPTETIADAPIFAVFVIST